MRSLRAKLAVVAVAIAVTVALSAAVDSVHGVKPGATPDTTKWRGFNLLGLFSSGSSPGYYEKADIDMIRELGFNLVRLPVDYRFIVRGFEPLAMDEGGLARLDEAIAWCAAAKVHVMLNLHRAPGYCINPIPEAPNDLWTNPARQRRFVELWTFLARRYAKYGADQLSFNLVNEPYGIADADYSALALRATAAIRAFNPARPVVSDGLEGGNVPAKGLFGTGIIQSARGYWPFTVSHYKASWVDGSDSWPVPTWPPTYPALSAYLYGPAKAEYMGPIAIAGDFPKGARVAILVDTVSGDLSLKGEADGKEIFSKDFRPGAGEGEWAESVYRSEWGIYQNRYMKEYSFTLPAAASSVALRVAEGDWLSLSRITVTFPDGSGATRYADDMEWGGSQKPLALSRGASGAPALRAVEEPADWSGLKYLEDYFKPWDEAIRAGVAVIVGESGAYMETPEPVVLAWERDWHELWKKRNVGWALWEFRGDFGILDTGRKDSDTVAWKGHLLSRKMLELLREY